MLFVADVLRASDQRRKHYWLLQVRNISLVYEFTINVLYLSNELQNLVSGNLV